MTYFYNFTHKNVMCGYGQRSNQPKNFNECKILSLYTRAEITFSRYIVSFNQSYIQDMKKYNLVE